jgi:alcohol dehydrogenase class IV
LSAVVVGLQSQQLAIGSGARTFFGSGSISKLADEIQRLGATRVFVVTDKGLVASGLCAKITSLLVERSLEVEVYSDLQPNPGIGDIEAGARALRNIDRPAGQVVLGLGGGTALDGAKAISLASENAGPLHDLDYRKKKRNPGLPVVAVPTTAGTGSETNSFAVIDDHEARRKFYIGDDSVAPKVAILDPDLTLGLPARPTASTGIDVLTHSLESLMARTPNPFSHALALQAIEMAGRWLPVAVEDGRSVEARAQMLLAAHMAGLAFANTGLGLAHALGHALSARLGTVHGVALAVVLPSVMELNERARGAELEEAAGALGASEAAAAVRALARRIGMPSTLTELGLTRDSVPALVRDALDDVVLLNNPVQPAPEQLTALVEALL